MKDTATEDVMAKGRKMTEDLPKIASTPREVRYDTGRHWRAKLGFVVLAMEQTVEDDVFRLTPPGVGVHFSRLEMSNSATVESLKSMAPGIEAAAGLILPEDHLDVVCYTCNCGTMVIGEERVNAALRRAKPEAQPTTVMTGVVHALKAIGAKRIVAATPYLDEVNAHVMRFLVSHGFDVLDLQGLNIESNTDIDLVDPQFIREFAAGLDRPDAEAVFVCCGALRALDIVGELEGDVGKPVVVSNQAMMWDCLRRAGIDDTIEGYGRLFGLSGRSVGLAA
jgi:maleate isomerase